MAAPAATPNAAAKLGGLRKAAAFLVAVGEDRATEIMRHLSATEAEALSLEIAKSPKVPSEVCAAVIDEAVVDFARSILERSLGADKAAEIVGRLAATIERRPFEFLRRTPPEQIHV